MEKIGIMGTGGVSQSLAAKFIKLNYDVMLGTRNVEEKLSSDTKDFYGNPPFKEWYAANTMVKLGTFGETSGYGEIILNATKGSESVSILKSLDLRLFAGKILIDVSNPLDFSSGMPPRLIPELCNVNSLGEEIQKILPEARVVKSFNTMWSGLMVNPGLINDGDHNICVCGNDNAAKGRVKEILISFGWAESNILDLGDITASRATEMYLPFWLRISGAVKSGAFNLKIVK
jgi:hypothetical protein